jgi:hypothetical protein
VVFGERLHHRCQIYGVPSRSYLRTTWMPLKISWDICLTGREPTTLPEYGSIVVEVAAAAPTSISGSMMYCIWERALRGSSRTYFRVVPPHWAIFSLDVYGHTREHIDLLPQRFNAFPKLRMLEWDDLNTLNCPCKHPVAQFNPYHACMYPAVGGPPMVALPLSQS